jgi:hypothetical protein
VYAGTCTLSVTALTRSTHPSAGDCVVVFAASASSVFSVVYLERVAAARAGARAKNALSLVLRYVLLKV